MTTLGYLPWLPTREDYVVLLERHVASLSGGLAFSELGKAPVKTYMLETGRGGQTADCLPPTLSEGVSLESVDDGLYRVSDALDHGGEIVGLLEKVDGRHLVFHTIMQESYSDRWMRNITHRKYWLDRVWLSSTILWEIWDQVKTINSSNRFVRFGFEHEPRFEVPDGPFDSYDISWDDAEDVGIYERKKSKMVLTEQIGEMDNILANLTKAYSSFHSLVQLQVPAKGCGGSLFEYDGKVTNKSDSFAGHRVAINTVLEMYKRITEDAEEKLGFKALPAGDDGFRLHGAPVYIQFEDKLSQEVFDSLVTNGLRNSDSVLGIGGFIHPRGSSKIHMSAIDIHLSQPFSMEVTRNHISMLLSSGVCGNIINRLITNLQRFITPKINVWLGSEPYEKAVHRARENCDTVGKEKI